VSFLGIATILGLTFDLWISWYFLAGMLVAALFQQYTKFRLRRLEEGHERHQSRQGVDE